MTFGSVKWLLDVGLPHGRYENVDAIHIDEFERRPGSAGVTEALACGRTLVTSQQDFRGPWPSGLEHLGIVVLESVPTDPLELERNLLHIEFRLSQEGIRSDIAGDRIVLQTDKGILRVLPDGREVNAEPWRSVWLPRKQSLIGAT